MNETQLVSNRKAFHDYTIEENFEAGIALLGSEVKSLKNHGGSLQDAFVAYDQGELWLKNASIAPYSTSSHFAPPERRDRKLLMHKSEIKKIVLNNVVTMLINRNVIDKKDIGKNIILIQA